MNITASMVAQLREITSLGMMECKKALVEANGDIKEAEKILRIKSGNRAGKVADRTAAEGIVAVCLSEDIRVASLVEINCETDFVAKDESLINFADDIAKLIIDNRISDVNALSTCKLKDGRTVEEERKSIIARVGENINIRRCVLLVANGVIATYLHGRKIGVICDISGDASSSLGKDVAMHIAATKPICVSRDDVPLEKIEEERNIYTKQALSSGKSPEIVSKMVDGRINKFLAEITLLGQPFVKNPDITVEKLLLDNKAKVTSFCIYVVGDGIDKKKIDFASEVALAASVK